MTEKVVSLRAIECGFDFDTLLEELKGREYQQALILTINGDGKFEWFGNLTVQDANFLLDRAKAWLLKDDDL